MPKPVPRPSVRAVELDAADEGWPIPPWQKVLGAVLRARSASVAARAHERDRPSLARGCLGRLAIGVLVLALGLGVALYFFAHSLLQGFSPY